MRGAPVVADLDRDGAADVVVTSRRTHVLSGKTGRPILEMDDGPTAGFTPAIADLDRNGAPDLVAMENRDCLVAIAGEHRVLWPLHVGTELLGDPAIADLDGDGRPEAVFRCDRSIVAVSLSSGSTLWRAEAPAHLHSASQGDPLPGDLDGDGLADVAALLHDGRVMALAGRTGRRLWIRPEKGVPYEPHSFSPLKPEPAMLDLDGNGRLVVVFEYPGRSGTILAIDGRTGKDAGTLPSLAGHRGLNSPVIGDIDGDRIPDLVLASIRSGSGWELLWTVSAVSSRSRNLLWSTPLDPARFVLWLALGHRDADGTADLVIAAGGSRIHALDARTGRRLWHRDSGGQDRPFIGWNQSIAHLDADAVSDVVLTAGRSLEALSGKDGARLWSYALGQDWYPIGDPHDLDGDGTPDLLVSSWNLEATLDRQTTMVRAISGRSGLPIDGFEHEIGLPGKILTPVIDLSRAWSRHDATSGRSRRHDRPAGASRPSHEPRPTRLLCTSGPETILLREIQRPVPPGERPRTVGTTPARPAREASRTGSSPTTSGRIRPPPACSTRIWTPSRFDLPVRRSFRDSAPAASGTAANAPLAVQSDVIRKIASLFGWKAAEGVPVAIQSDESDRVSIIDFNDVPLRMVIEAMVYRREVLKIQRPEVELSRAGAIALYRWLAAEACSGIRMTPLFSTAYTRSSSSSTHIAMVRRSTSGKRLVSVNLNARGS
jgi:outer membrane protein assembly factor BamB